MISKVSLLSKVLNPAESVDSRSVKFVSKNLESFHFDVKMVEISQQSRQKKQTASCEGKQTTLKLGSMLSRLPRRRMSAQNWARKGTPG